MKKILTAAVIALIVVAALTPTVLQFMQGDSPGDYMGIDATIMEARAEEAGRPARDPLINTDQGDLLLFVFMIGGLGSGIALGYFGRILLVEGRSTTGQTRRSADGRATP
ncbi:MAG: hypothetical protein KKA32_04710 [Actinobacteria bacterium]|nr:hypothetical protein [Actinomycetota bacterium]